MFAKPDNLETWPNDLNFRCLTRDRSSSYVYFPMDLSASFFIGNIVLVRNVQYPLVVSHLNGLRSFL